jgi:hypothetical protein
MPRITRRPLIGVPANIDRKEIERRAREATQPAPLEKQGRWPFSVKGPNDAPQASDIEQPSRPVVDGGRHFR